MTDTWNKFVYKLIECKNHNVEEATYHSTIEDKLELLGWAAYRGEICHKINLPIGSVGCIQPDILVRKDEENMFVIEVKKPNHIRNERELQQLFSYMLQLRLKVGVYIGEYLEVFYDQPENNEVPVSILKADIALDDKNGVQFAELFSKEKFGIEPIKQLYEKLVLEKQKEEKLYKIKADLLADDSGLQLTNIVKQHLLKKYESELTEQAIESLLSSLIFRVYDKSTTANSALYGKSTNDEEVKRIQDYTRKNLVEEYNTPITQRTNNHKRKNKHDTTTYTLNGGYPMGKNEFVLAIVKEYIHLHPEKTYQELEDIFKPQFQLSGNRIDSTKKSKGIGVIRTISFIKEHGYEDDGKHKRYHDEILQSADNQKFKVSTQWGIFNIRNIVELAKQLGFDVKEIL